MRSVGVRADLGADRRHVAGMARQSRRAFATRALKDGRLPLLPSDVCQRLSRSRRTGLAHGLPGRGRIDFTCSPCRGSRRRSRSRHRRRWGGRPDRAFRRAQQRRRQPLRTAPSSTSKTRARRSFSEADAAQLRTYLLKGGLMWSDDFSGLPRVDSAGRTRSGASFHPSAFRSSTCGWRARCSRPSTASSASCRCPPSAAGGTAAARRQSGDSTAR